jgi:hypothetical protein
LVIVKVATEIPFGATDGGLKAAEIVGGKIAALIVVLAVAATGVAPAAVAVAVLVIVVPLGVAGLTSTVKVKIAEAPATSVGLVHVKVLLPNEQAKAPGATALRKVRPAGNWSVSVTLFASLGPVLDKFKV